MTQHDTIQSDKQGRKTPTARPPKAEAIAGSLQSQIDCLHTSVSLLMERFNGLDERCTIAERKASSLLELRDLNSLARERSRESIKRASSRADGRNS